LCSILRMLDIYMLICDVWVVTNFCTKVNFTSLMIIYKLVFKIFIFMEHFWTVAYRRGWGFNPPPPEIPKFYKAEPNSQFRGKYMYICNNLIRIQDSLIFKLSRTPD
jgi:hypothetical protein